MYLFTVSQITVVFMYQIPLQRKKVQAKQPLRWQLVSCQGNEREMWRGQTSMCSKRSALLFVEKSTGVYVYCIVRLTFPFYIYIKWSSFHLTGKASTSKWMKTSAGTVTSWLCLHTWKNIGKAIFLYFDPFVCRSEGEDQQVKMKCFRWFYFYVKLLPSVPWKAFVALI